MRALLAGAVTISITAVLSVATAPLIGDHAGVQILLVGASVVVWVAWIGERLSQQRHRESIETRLELVEARLELADARRQINRLREYSEVGSLLRAVGGDRTIALPTPHGTVRAEATKVDGEDVLVGVDEDADLAPPVELRRVLNPAKRGADE